MSGWCRTCSHFQSLHYLINSGQNITNYTIERLSAETRSDDEIMKYVKNGNSNYNLACSKYNILFTQLKDNCSGHKERY